MTITDKRAEAQDFFKLDSSKKTLLVLGGSLGARAINRLIEENLDFLIASGVQLIWQTGKLYIDEYKKYDTKDATQTHAFLNKMDLAYAAADFIISRAGAGSISELCMVGKPVIFIPSPNVSEDHQTKNAIAIVQKDAAILLKENELENFPTIFKSLIDDSEKQHQLAENIQKLALPDATKQIVEQVKRIIKH